MNIRNTFRQVALLLCVLITAANAVACPDCAMLNSGGTIEPQTVTAKMAFSSSTLFFLTMFFSVVSFLIWMMVKTCRDLNLERSPSSPSQI